MQSLLWYDLETFGRHPGWDRIAQYASLRTNDKFEIIEEPTVVYCRISPDYLPDPGACLITGITPKVTGEKGLIEAEFVKIIHQEMSTPGTCTVGYNSLRFDDEFVRNLFYRNFIDPYKREYSQGNSRWDIIDLVRMTHDLRPEGINWVYDDVGRPIFRLEELTKANNISHEHAHDALSDVYGTVALAKLIHDKQPKLFQFYYSLRKKDAVRRYLNLQNPQPLVHTSGMFTRSGACSTVIVPITADPDNNNLIHCFDLRQNPELLINLSVEELKYRIFTPQVELGDKERIPIKGVYTNRSPAIAPLNTLEDRRAQALGLNIPMIKEHFSLIQKHPDILIKIRQVFSGRQLPHHNDPDLQIYQGGFFGDHDREVFDRIPQMSMEELTSYKPDFQDARGPELLRRYIGRNYPHLMSEDQQKRWKSYCAGRLLAPEWSDADNMNTFKRKIASLLGDQTIEGKSKKVLADLKDYGAWLESHILS
ncbi:exodeoxyribonuclease I [Spirochaeta cellobiosiphila]|uniref:exodeoxyribonuclease I n=1 Tax=Spirochaeta cellobiosiphila TaxID=504483 RepID=UPI0004172C24|nr:exodeoxyribonuclease I [Spirochaeta cellobiosiphila]